MYETEYNYPGSVPESSQATIDSLNSGYDHVIHIGHGFRFNMSVGDGSIVNADADSLKNAPRYSNFYLLNCTAVAFTYFCLGRALPECANGGAVSAVGANESAFPITSSYYMNEYYRLVFKSGRRSPG